MIPMRNLTMTCYLRLMEDVLYVKFDVVIEEH